MLLNGFSGGGGGDCDKRLVECDPNPSRQRDIWIVFCLNASLTLNSGQFSYIRLLIVGFKISLAFFFLIESTNAMTLQ